MEERYLRSLGALTQEDIDQLHQKRACVVGCGGIGGYVIEFLSRIGIGSLTVVDGDSFVLSNLNRQLLSSEDNIGLGKAQIALDHVHSINSNVHVTAITEYITSVNANDILRNHDIVVDALDNISARRILAESCSSLGVTLIHGAISGWCAQISVIAPGSHDIERIYPSERTESKQASSLSFTPALAASIQTAEAVKVLLSKEISLKSKLLIVDMLTQEYNTVIL